MARLQRGKAHVAQTPEVSDIRALTRGELSVLAVKRPPNSLQNLRDTHHRVARAVAAGLRNDEISALCGYSYNRISILKGDPSFMELVAHYRGLITAEFVRNADPVIEYMQSNALKAQAMLSDKLDKALEEDTFLPTRDLLGIAELGLDRTGYGKVNKNLNVNVDFAANLEAARKRASAADALRTIEAPTSRPPQSPQADHSPALVPRPAVPNFRRM